MANVDVKYLIFQHRFGEKNMDSGAVGINVIAVRHVAEAFNLNMNTAPANRV
ncbi:Uncharacterised protein [Yersinia pseudotuberculosis]|nr:hypothetical protein DJ40_3185 [Yersinia pseudotuberculosis]AJJ07690.1 hypothetical protein BZ20_2862 [Yersinia pseudotuberculosis]CNK76197.1 Uncharacterised protein [Yersinia pseudotuberculosis]CNL45893.1 Uncharacterised protein [Yersinia pseudotuberculosis]SUQ16993.1 Uncharacterised protein [Yersinia pseudotuberculosis]